MARKRKIKPKTALRNGLPVEDATVDLVLDVQKQDCTTGHRKDPHKCAAAKAALREDGVLDAEVYRTRTYLLLERNGKRFYRRFQTPAKFRTEMVSFDRGGGMEPGEYVFKAVAPSQQLGMQYKVRPDRRKRHDLGTKRRKPLSGIRPVGPRFGGYAYR